MPIRTYEIEAPANGGAAPCWIVDFFEDGRRAGGALFAVSAFNHADHPGRAAHEAAEAAGERWIAREGKRAT